ncbi:hypothetical protein IWZ03DRAFT_409260, partial [Phyllosticta citriasiana]
CPYPRSSRPSCKTPAPPSCKRHHRASHHSSGQQGRGSWRATRRAADSCGGSTSHAPSHAAKRKTARKRKEKGKWGSGCATTYHSNLPNQRLALLLKSSKRNYRRLFPTASGSALAAASARSSTPSTCGCACAGAGGRGAGGAQAAVPVVVARRLGGWRGDETGGFASGRRGWRVRCLLGSLVARVLDDGQARWRCLLGCVG